MKPKAKIKDWVLFPCGFGRYVLIGDIIEHPNKPTFSTERQMTSLVKSIDFEKKIAETRNTIYELVD